MPLLGNLAAVVFLISLMASGISSSVVGTMAGQVIMQSFVGFAVPLWVRRFVTMLPASSWSRSASNVTQTLIVSQVVLSFVLPVPVIALVWLTARAGDDGPDGQRSLGHRFWRSRAALQSSRSTRILLWTTFHPA